MKSGTYIKLYNNTIYFSFSYIPSSKLTKNSLIKGIIYSI